MKKISPTSHQNVLLIQTDEWNARCLELMGHPNVRTPNLDYLAGQGALFREAYCQNPLCMPSRISMLSGQYPTTNREFGFSGLCDRRMSWMPAWFRENGYATGAFGKFHTASIGNDSFGFDVAAPTLGEDEELAQPAGFHYRSYCEANGVGWPTDQMHGHNPWGGFGASRVVPSSAKDEMTWTVKGACRSDVPVEHSLETWTTNRCLDFLRERAEAEDDKPFFAWLSYDRPHWPFNLPEPWFSRADPSSNVRHPGYDETDPHLPAYLLNHPAREETPGDDLDRVMAVHHTLLEWLDAEVGRVMEALRRTGLDQNTTIVFTSDHGDEAGYRQLFHKHFGCHTREVLAVPLIIRPAPALGAAAGTVCDDKVELVDLFPTLCAMNGLRTPEAVEGRSLWPGLSSGSFEYPDRAAFCEKYDARAIIWKDWILTESFVEAPSALINVADDPWGLRDRYCDPDAATVRLEMKRRLLAFLARRRFGPYADEDVAFCRSRLDGQSHLPGLCLDGIDGLTFFRAGATIREGEVDSFCALLRGC